MRDGNYRPSNGTEGDFFYSEWCEHCKRERPIRDDYDRAVRLGLGCAIYLRSMGYQITDAEYPTEWTYAPDGVPKCTAFQLDIGEDPDEPAKPKRPPRCDKTLELFPETK